MWELENILRIWYFFFNNMRFPALGFVHPTLSYLSAYLNVIYPEKPASCAVSSIQVSIPWNWAHRGMKGFSGPQSPVAST